MCIAPQVCQVENQDAMPPKIASIGLLIGVDVSKTRDAVPNGLGQFESTIILRQE
jgi:hypothetical protein